MTKHVDYQTCRWQSTWIAGSSINGHSIIGTRDTAASAPFIEGGGSAQRGGGICSLLGSRRAAQIPHVRCAAVAPFSKGGWKSAGR
jgi:hypothetical protein